MSDHLEKPSACSYCGEDGHHIQTCEKLQAAREEVADDE